MTMDLNQSIFKSIESEIQRTDGDPENNFGVFGSQNSNEACTAFEKQTNPRDGMSAESAMFEIGKCNQSGSYKVYRMTNKGRYFIARVLDKEGKLVNEIMVDKLNGRVRFFR